MHCAAAIRALLSPQGEQNAAAKAEPLVDTGRNYSIDDLHLVAVNVCLPDDFKKRTALIELVHALEKPDAAPAQSSTAASKAAPSQEGVGQGEIAEGAATLEPVAYLYTGRDTNKVRRQWASVSDTDHWPIDQWETIKQELLYVIPPGYCVVPE